MVIKVGFKLRCKVCGKVLGPEDSPIEEIQRHAEEELLNYFDAMPTVSMKEKK